MVTKEEFEHFVAEFEGFRDLLMDELEKLTNTLEGVQEDVKELKAELKISDKKLG